jgi:hypothetical protein
MKERRFARGSKAYTKEGRTYTVEGVEDGTVYCSLSNGTEIEFSETSLMTEAEWSAKSNTRRDFFYAHLRQSPLYTTHGEKVDRAPAETLLALSERLPGLLDYIAFAIATRVATAKGEHKLLRDLSIIKCRDIFDGTPPDVRANLIADVLGLHLDQLMNACSLGENMARAMLERGLATQTNAFEAFCDRPRT